MISELSFAFDSIARKMLFSKALSVKGLPAKQSTLTPSLIFLCFSNEGNWRHWSERP